MKKVGIAPKKLVLIIGMFIFPCALFATAELTVENIERLSGALNTLGFEVENISVEDENYTVDIAKDGENLQLILDEEFNVLQKIVLN